MSFLNFKKNSDWLDNIALVSQLGFTMVGCILFCLAIGYFLDKWLGMRGLFTIIFTLLGVIGGGVTVFRQIARVVDLKDKSSSGKTGKDGQ